MHLVIKREQRVKTNRRGQPTGFEYAVSYQLRVTPEEQSVIDEHGLGPTYVIGDHSSTQRFSYTVTKLIEGGGFSETSARSALGTEELVLKGARNAAALLSQVYAFDGLERTIELTGSDAD